ncbi:MAG: DUF2971 domain-containing protein [Bacteroidales bacterium]|nr:DUF2971 domain-containing protein [Bacteroidales bacterium]
MVINENIYLARLDVFDDHNEGVSPNKILFERYKEELIKRNPELMKLNEMGINIQIDADKSDEFEAKLKYYQKTHFASCWYLSEENEESIAMWNLYSAPNSVALRIRYKDFKMNVLESGFSDEEKFEKLVFRKVKYLNFFNPNDLLNEIDNIDLWGFIKDQSYSYENEYRILGKCEYIEPPEKRYKKGLARKDTDELYEKIYNIKGKELHIKDFTKYKFEVVMHPKSQDWAFKDLNKLLNKLTTKGNLQIIDSKLKI